MNTVKIALTGKMRSGKSTVALYLVEKYGFKRFSFAEKLKKHANEIFGEQANPRKLYQWFGQTMRQYDPDIWVRKCFESIEMSRLVHETYYIEGVNGPFRVVIDDLRQQNEYERCRSEGFIIVRVTAPEEIRIDRLIDSGEEYDDATFYHETEMYVDNFVADYEIRNDGDFNSLHAQVDAIMRELDVTKTNKGAVN